MIVMLVMLEGENGDDTEEEDDNDDPQSKKMMLGPPALVSLAGFSLGRHFGSSDLFINGGAIPSLRNATMYTLVTYLEMQCNPLYSVQ